MNCYKTYLGMILLMLITGCYDPTGCYGPMAGTVVDAETGKPIEGAVVYVQWTIKTGLPGLISTKTYDVIEKITDKDGTFRVWGILNPMVNKPLVVVYKKGYVAWRSDYIFPEYGHRKDFGWMKDYMFKLEQFKRYSHSRHILFTHGALSLGVSSKLDQAYSWELPLARKEEKLLREKRKTKKPDTYTEKKIWQEIVEELYSRGGAK